MITYRFTLALVTVFFAATAYLMGGILGAAFTTNPADAAPAAPQGWSISGGSGTGGTIGGGTHGGVDGGVDGSVGGTVSK